MLKTINETYKILDPSRDSNSVLNKFSGIPQGIIIQDTFNNPFFPITPIPKLDSDKIDLITIYDKFKELYSLGSSLFLPWHYCIEFIKNRYFIFNTRPIDMKFPMTSKEAKSNSNLWGLQTTLFFNDNLFDVKDAIHIAVIGDTTNDVYTSDFYKLLGATTSPIRRYFKFGGLYNKIFLLNIGSKFNLSLFEKYV